jgi:predicted nucleotide-binding protein
MSRTIQILQELIEQGEKFTYKNFCGSWSKYGHPETYAEEWVIWRSRVQTFMFSKFGEDSIPAKTLKSGLSYSLIGNEEKNFVNAKTLILSALKSAKISIEDEVLPKIGSPRVSETGVAISNKVFIVHGHDEKAKNELEIFLTEIGLEPVVLHRQADEGQTIIEKFEKHSDVGYAFILLTPDEMSYTVDQSNLPESDRNIEQRARPNVIFEFGYFVGKLGRKRVCCLYTGSVKLPSDINGLLYKPFTQSIEESGYGIIKELKAAGYNLKV